MDYESTYSRWRQLLRTEYFQQQYDPPRGQPFMVIQFILILLGADLLASSLKATFEVYKVLYIAGKIKVRYLDHGFMGIIACM